MNYKRSILITGGAGFIGSHVVRLFVNKYPDYRIINLDKLTYAGNLANLKDIEKRPNYVFVKADICDLEAVRKVISEYAVDGVIHLAAESHVDRSIKDPFIFAKTNVLGTLTLLQAVSSGNRKDGKESGSTIFPQMRSMGLLNLQGRRAIRLETSVAEDHLETPSSLKSASTSLIVRTRRPRPQAIILSGLIMTPTGCRPL